MTGQSVQRHFLETDFDFGGTFHHPDSRVAVQSVISHGYPFTVGFLHGYRDFIGFYHIFRDVRVCRNGGLNLEYTVHTFCGGLHVSCFGDCVDIAGLHVGILEGEMVVVSVFIGVIDQIRRVSVTGFVDIGDDGPVVLFFV